MEESHTAIAEMQEKLQTLQASFLPSPQQLFALKRYMMAEMDTGLRGSSSLAMLPTFIEKPNQRRSVSPGIYYAVDLGGTHCRVCV